MLWPKGHLGISEEKNNKTFSVLNILTQHILTRYTYFNSYIT